MGLVTEAQFFTRGSNRPGRPRASGFGPIVAARSLHKAVIRSLSRPVFNGWPITNEARDRNGPSTATRSSHLRNCAAQGVVMTSTYEARPRRFLCDTIDGGREALARGLK